MNPIQEYHKFKHKGGLNLEMQEERQKTDYTLQSNKTILGGAYTPKNQRTNNAARIMEKRNQRSINSCVCTSGGAGKEPDEHCLCDEQVVVNYLVQRGEMDKTGTSLSAFQNALKNFGIPERAKPVNYNQSWDAFWREKPFGGYSSNAAKHKNKSYYRTTDLNKVLEELDNCRMGHTGGEWYSGYNPSQVAHPFILTPKKGYYVGGHATLIVDYDMDYMGGPVLKVLNSYGEESYDEGFFYVRFEDFSTIFSVGVYFWTDMEKNVLGWLSNNQGKLIKEKNSPKIYLVTGELKRHVPDEAYLWMLEKPWEEDTEDMLPSVKTGDELRPEEIPLEKRQRYHDLVAYSKDPKWMKDKFQKYFPDLYT